MAVGQTTAPFETTSDNTLNVVKLIAKQQLPDSVEFRMIQVGGETAEAAQKKADSIYTAIKAGAPFDSIAKKYGQEGAKQWLTSAQYQNSTSIDADSKEYLMTLNTLPAGELRNLKFSQGNVVVQVTDRRNFVTKYDLAIIKHTIDFSKQTYSDAYNKFSQYVSENNTIEGLEKNAEKYGFKVMERNDLMSTEHNVVGVRATREAMKCIFDRLSLHEERMKTKTLMLKTVNPEGGVTLSCYFQERRRQQIEFDDELAFKGFVHMLSMMEATGAESVKVSV